MADQRLVIAPSAQCRQHDHHFLPVAVADDVAVWNEEACSECTTVYRGALDAGTTEEVAARVVRPRSTLLAAGDVSGAIPATQPEGDAFTRGTAVPCGYPDRRLGVRSREISSQSTARTAPAPRSEADGTSDVRTFNTRRPGSSNCGGRRIGSRHGRSFGGHGTSFWPEMSSRPRALPAAVSRSAPSPVDSV